MQHIKMKTKKCKLQHSRKTTSIPPGNTGLWLHLISDFLYCKCQLARKRSGGAAERRPQFEVDIFR